MACLLLCWRFQLLCSLVSGSAGLRLVLITTLLNMPNFVWCFTRDLEGTVPLPACNEEEVTCQLQDRRTVWRRFRWFSIRNASCHSPTTARMLSSSATPSMQNQKPRGLRGFAFGRLLGVMFGNFGFVSLLAGDSAMLYWQFPRILPAARNWCKRLATVGF